ncbi:molybdenum ABC transporter, periplasmic molybdate-binding protein [Desulfofarcimen acetoxidans DSM 771]|uniref:Molybdenum ABC transporter, periplasmic molybdate-binding protein n=1 Tax=Desulfofarcimen acetoxidans (strain ATCC 49208 / DSM 771 / KCTC 5769 / VKM B-1644 / 5575) TaxID=485916 RepID=C8W6R6_DESAS|nr:molybdate ABC transporter substrate-binding protein [Desulfofarcimen acetoxidans]ACV64175.1 molybdenum ABC transporter, periplasmic molybdate-binding protein [Desulfofarcimen acetoxidans DSM 771]
MNYTIMKNDTLAGIAERFGTTVSAIMNANPQIKNQDFIVEGQIITIPVSGAPSPPAGQKTYIVQAGDTMFTISQKYGIELETLIAANPQIKNPDLIFPGQVINIPGRSSLTVYAAASLKDAFEELKRLYLKQNPGVDISYNFGASGTLQREIEQGAPVDLFVSAGESQMDALSKKGLIVESSRKNLLSNQLVLIANKNSRLKSFEGLTDPSITKISIGNPRTVPAGEYARETLKTLGLWNSIQSKLVLAEDVRQVLQYVESGRVDAGLVYRSDALTGKNIRIVAVAPDDSHKPIIYPMAIIRSSNNREEARAFANFLSSNEAARVFSKYGFIPLQ